MNSLDLMYFSLSPKICSHWSSKQCQLGFSGIMMSVAVSSTSHFHSSPTLSPADGTCDGICQIFFTILMPLHLPQNGIKVILLHFKNVIPTAPHKSQHDSNENPTEPHKSWRHGLGLAGHFKPVEVETLCNHRDSTPNIRGCKGACRPKQLCSAQGNYRPVIVQGTHGHPWLCS